MRPVLLQRYVFPIFTASFIMTPSWAPAQERVISVELTESQWNTIGKALAKQPFEEVVSIMSELQRQTRNAIAAREMELKQLRDENKVLKEAVR